jgi:Spy/CpxP family protein refolding chaperone
MKRLISFLIGIFVWFSLMAMIPKVKIRNPEKRAEQIAAFLQQKLGLTDEQTQKIKTAQIEALTKIRAIHQNQALTTDAKLEQLREVRKEQLSSICQVLTPEQKADFETNCAQWFEEFRRQLRKKYQEKEGELRCPLSDSSKRKVYRNSFLEKMRQELNLTSEQIEKIKDIQKEQHQKIAQLHSRCNSEDKEMFKSQLREILQQTQKRIREEVLTPEQGARVEEKMKAIHRHLKSIHKVLKDFSCDGNSSSGNNSELKKSNTFDNTNKANLYPNPANKTAQVVLSLTSPMEVAIQVIDKTGQKRAQQSYGLLPAGEVTLSMDLSQLPADTYTIQAMGAGRKLLMTKQLILQSN